MDKIMITIGRQFGSGGREIGKKIARELEIPYYDKKLLAVAARESGLALDFLQDMDEKHPHSLLYSLCVGRPNLVLGNCNISVERMASKAQREAVLHVAGQGAASSWDVVRTTSCGTKPACSVSLFPPVWTSAFSVWSNATV